MFRKIKDHLFSCVITRSKKNFHSSTKQFDPGLTIIWILFFVLLTLNYFYSVIFITDPYGDDPFNIFQNPDLLIGNLFNAITSGTANRPLLMATLWIERNLWGLNYMSLKIVNVILLSLWGLIFYLFLKTVDRHRLPSAIPCLFALCFILHPIHHQAINTVIQRGVILSGIFSLLSYYFFIHTLNHGDRKSWLMSLMFFFLGVLSKEVCVFLPLSFLLFAFVLKKPFFKTILLSLPFFLICFTPILFNIFMHAGTQTVTPSVLEYFLAETKITLQYLWISIFPYGLQYVFYVPTSKNPLEYGALAAILVHLTLIYLILRLGRSRSMAMVFGLTIYLAWIPESSFYPLEQLGYLHRMSIPLTFVFLFVYLAVPLGRFPPRKIVATLSLLAIVYIGLTNFRSWQINTLEKRSVECLRDSSHYPTMFISCLCGITLSRENREDFKKFFDKSTAQGFVNIDLFLMNLAHEAFFGQSSAIKILKIQILANYLRSVDRFTDINPATRLCTTNYIGVMMGTPEFGDWFQKKELYVSLITPQMPIFEKQPQFFGLLINSYQTNLVYLNSRYYFESNPPKKSLYYKTRTLLKQYFPLELASRQHTFSLLEDP